VRCYGIRDIEQLGGGAAARNLVRGGNQIVRRDRQSGRMQRLANVASGFGSVGVMVEKRDARRDIQQHHAAENGQRLPCETASRISSNKIQPHQVHRLQRHLV
jgi:hypothetical protein